MAVVVSVAAILSVLMLNRHRPFFVEIYYVWQLKMELNFINAKLRHIETSASNDDQTALTVLCYYYQASRQLWTLDDNLISIDTLDIKQNKLIKRLSLLNLDISATDYQRNLLKQF